MRPPVGDRQVGRIQAGQVDFPAVRADDRVVRARSGRDPRDDLAILRADDVPERAFEADGRKIRLAVRRDRHPVAASVVGLLPEELLRDQVEAHQLLDGADVEPLGSGAGADPLDVDRRPLLIEAGCRDPLDEAMAVVDVEDEQAMAAVLEVIADARLGHVEPMMDLRAPRGSSSPSARGENNPVEAYQPTSASITVLISR